MTTKKVTITVQIGNSDNKLPQLDWSDFISEVNSTVQELAEIHFSGGSAYNSRYQNACIVANIDVELLPILRNRLYDRSRDYIQDSIALTIGHTEFITREKTE